MAFRRVGWVSIVVVAMNFFGSLALAQDLEAPKLDEPNADLTTSGITPSEVPKSENAKSGVSPGNPSKSEAAESDAPKSDAPKSDAPKSGAPTIDPLTLGGQGNFALGLQLGFYQSSGAGLQFGTSAVALAFSGGFMPVVYNEGYRAKIAFLPSYQADSDLLVRFFKIQGKTPIGLRVGHRFNSVLGHGIALGGYVERRLTRVVAVSGNYGLIVYPKALARLREEGHDATGIGGILGGGLTVGLLFYP